MDLPSDPADFTLDTIKFLLQRSPYEPDRYDFKAVLNVTEEGKRRVTQKKSDKPEEDDRNVVISFICRTACSMANLDGGFIIFGVREPRNGDKSSLDRIVGIPKAGEPAHDFAKKVQAIHPGIRFDPAPRLIDVDENAGKGIFVVRVPRSPLRPHMYDGRFPKRTSGGNAQFMDVTEIREQMLNTEERLRKLELLRTEIAHLFQTHEELRREGDMNLHVMRFDTSGLKPLMVETCALFPPHKKLEEGLTTLALAANHANGLMDRLNQVAFEGGVDSGAASKWRDLLSARMDEIKKRTHETGHMIREIFDDARGRRSN